MKDYIALDEPEPYRQVGNLDYMSLAEWLRRRFGGSTPYRPDLGRDKSLLRLGQVAASIARGPYNRIEPVKLYHPDYGSVNGLPAYIWEEAWDRFSLGHEIEFSPISQPQRSLEFLNDERWGDLLQQLLKSGQPDETPEQTLLRRTSVAAAMYVIEKEYER